MNLCQLLSHSLIHGQYADLYDTVISADESGFIEYWQPFEPYEPPTHNGMWSFKSATDLYEFKKHRTRPTSITISPNQTHFVTLSASDRQVRIFDLLSGKMTRKYDESLAAVQEMQQAGTAVYRVEDMEFGRRLALEREIDEDELASKMMNAVWDESGNFVLYPTLLGIKGEFQFRSIYRPSTECIEVVNITTNKVAKILGKDDPNRWLNLSLYQGSPAKKGFTTAVCVS